MNNCKVHDAEPGKMYVAYCTCVEHPRNDRINREPMRRWRAHFVQWVKHDPAPSHNKPEEEIRWCWGEIGQLRAALNIYGLLDHDDDTTAPPKELES